MLLRSDGGTSRACGWAGRILRVDLSNETAETIPTEPLGEKYLGGRGFATRLAWEQIPRGVRAFDPGNLLMFMAGPLTGTTAPFSGRSIVCSVSPQAYPEEWFTRSGMGGHWGPELKYAGYDGIVVGGASEEPVYLLVRDGRVELLPAGDLWGKGIYETQKTLLSRHGADSRIVACGQAGENRSRIAVISTETESSAGQGGFGAVMGSKKLKAIVVRGTGHVRIARPDSFTERTRLITAEINEAQGVREMAPLDPDGVKKYGQKYHACTQQCTAKWACAQYFSKVPGPLLGGVNSGQFHCVAPIFPGIPNHYYDWKVGFEAGFELAKVANDLGINHWDILLGLMPMLRLAKQEGVLSQLDGMEIDLDSPRFWLTVLQKIGSREGIGDVLAEGGLRAGRILGVPEELITPFYNAWGSAGHWDGHGDRANVIVFPYWVVSALQWALDTRDPISSGHDFVHVNHWAPVMSDKAPTNWDQAYGIARRLYGTERAIAPDSGYEAKEIPAFWHSHRSVLKDSMLVDDYHFPRIVSRATPDRFSRAGDMEGPSFEYFMFVDATGSEMSEAEFNTAPERIYNLDRMFQVRNYGRNRQHDEMVIPHFELEENLANPYIGSKQKLDAVAFRRLLTDYYRLRGWDPESGCPRPETLDRLGLPETKAVLSLDKTAPVGI